MKKMEIEQMENLQGGLTAPGCSQAAGWLFGAGVGICLFPGLLPLGIALMASSSVGAMCND